MKAGMMPADEVQATWEAYLREKRMPIHRPSVKRVALDMEHTGAGRGSRGNRGPNQSRFPQWVTPGMAEKCCVLRVNRARKFNPMGTE